MTSRTSETLVDLIGRQTERTPDRIAVAGAGRKLTYRQLDLIATRLAARLAARGAGPETVIGLCANRTPEMIAAAVGIMLSGAAYLFLDPAYPRERIRFMLEDSGTELIVAEPTVREYLPSGFPTVGIEAEDEGEASAFPTSPTPGNLAYLVYTSGSTGQPKGVGVEHRSLMALIEWARSYFGPDVFQSVLGSTSMSFDVSVFEIFTPLTYGGTIHVMRDLLELAEATQVPRLSLINAVPSVLTELVSISGLPRGIPNMCLAGEALSRNLVCQLYQEYDVGQVFNLYGPSEATVYSTVYPVPRDENGPVPIGKPIAGGAAEITQAMEALGSPADAAVREGELNIIGAGVARGYIGRPMLTAERFVPATEGLHGERAYRTGDLVRLREDGNLEFLGRSDEQVKIHGIRIELGEIEAVLGTHPSVAQVKVSVRESPSSGLPQLLAYATLRPGATSVGLATLREHAAIVLPEQMLPSELVLLDRLPLLPSGKLDRSALPSPADDDSPALADDNPDDDSRPPVPAAPASHVLAIWSRLLDRQNIGLDDDFFAIGGDSLAAVRAVWELRASLKAEIPLRVIYKHRTARALTEWLAMSLEPAAKATGDK